MVAQRECTFRSHCRACPRSHLPRLSVLRSSMHVAALVLATCHPNIASQALLNLFCRVSLTIQAALPTLACAEQAVCFDTVSSTSSDLTGGAGPGYRALTRQRRRRLGRALESDAHGHYRTDASCAAARLRRRSGALCATALLI